MKKQETRIAKTILGKKRIWLEDTHYPISKLTVKLLLLREYVLRKSIYTQTKGTELRVQNIDVHKGGQFDLQKK